MCVCVLGGRTRKVTQKGIGKKGDMGFTNTCVFSGLDLLDDGHNEATKEKVCTRTFFLSIVCACLFFSLLGQLGQGQYKPLTCEREKESKEKRGCSLNTKLQVD